MSGSLPATIPAPACATTGIVSVAIARYRDRPADLGAPQRDRPLAVAVRVDPADRPGVAAAVERLDAADDLDRGIRRRPCDRRGRVQRRDEVERRGVVGEFAGDIGGEMPEVRQLEHERLGVGAQRAGVRRRGRRATLRTANRCSFEVFRRCARGQSDAAASPSASAPRGKVPASTRAVTAPPDTVTRVSGLAPMRPSTANVQVSGYPVDSARASRRRSAPAGTVPTRSRASTTLPTSPRAIAVEPGADGVLVARRIERPGAEGRRPVRPVRRLGEGGLGGGGVEVADAGDPAAPGAPADHERGDHEQVRALASGGRTRTRRTRRVRCRAGAPDRRSRRPR